MFKAVMLAGTVGTLTGEKNYAFSVSMNLKNPHSDEKMIFWNLLMTFMGFHQTTWSLRKTLENCNDYDCAYDKLTWAVTSSWGYYALAGTGDN